MASDVPAVAVEADVVGVEDPVDDEVDDDVDGEAGAALDVELPDVEDVAEPPAAAPPEEAPDEEVLDDVLPLLEAPPELAFGAAAAASATLTPP
jgi:hypothetical protein